MLKPIGLVQRGRSRMWLDDHGWWLGIDYFGPSAWAPGSYARVYASFLWSRSDSITLDYSLGNLDEQHVLYESDKQFAPEALRLASLAAPEIEQVRATYRSLHDWLPLFEERASAEEGWPVYDAGIANGLLGNTERARSWLEALHQDDDRDWAQEGRRYALNLARTLEQPQKFRQAIVRDIATSRSAQRLALRSDLELEPR